jgi:hypothetical protein
MKILSLILIMLMILFFVLGDVEMNIRQEDPSYKKALMELSQQYESGESSYDEKIPMERPAGLGVGSNIRKINPEAQVEDIDISMEIYRRYKQERDANAKLKNSEGAVKFSVTPPSRESASEDTKKILESNIKDAGNRASRYFKDLKKAFPKLTTKQISAIVGNLDHESQGFTQFYEQGVKVGGEGDAQWTAERRNDFIAFTEENDLNPKSYEASRDFLIYELKNNRVHGFENWDDFDSFNDPTKSVSELTHLFERRYFVAGKPMTSKRQKLANSYYKDYSLKNREER